MANYTVTLEVGLERVASLLPSLRWALDAGLLSEREALALFEEAAEDVVVSLVIEEAVRRTAEELSRKEVRGA